jgi:8-oxo-dGTP diphosphatase
MARTPILAAGGIVLREGPRPLIAIVKLRKSNDWVLPKGKLKPKERAITAARREVVEETGHNVMVHEFLGAMTYQTSANDKIVQFWRMRVIGPQIREPQRDIKAVDWLPLEDAIRKLDRPIEQLFLRKVAHCLVAQPTQRKRDARIRPLPRRQPRSRIQPAAMASPDPWHASEVAQDAFPNARSPLAAAATPACSLVTTHSAAGPEPPARANALQRLLRKLWRLPAADAPDTQQPA